MRKFVMMFMAAAFSFSLAGCGSKPAEKKTEVKKPEPAKTDATKAAPAKADEAKPAAEKAK